jgi:hypothetical protein
MHTERRLTVPLHTPYPIPSGLTKTRRKANVLGGIMLQALQTCYAFVTIDGVARYCKESDRLIPATINQYVSDSTLC